MCSMPYCSSIPSGRSTALSVTIFIGSLHGLADYPHGAFNCTSFRYNQSMPTQLIDSADPVFDAAHLVYRVRSGSINSPLIIMIHGLGGDENVMWIFERALPDQATAIAPRAPLWIEPDTPHAEEASGGYSWFR